MFRKLGILMAVMGLALPAWSAAGPGTISGYVRNAGGVPQMGAVVEVLGSAVLSSKVFTDDRGFYSIAGLLPGTYNLKVSAPSFLPALRERVGLRPGAKLMVNVTLTTLFEAIQLGRCGVRPMTMTGIGRFVRSPIVPFCVCCRTGQPQSLTRRAATAT